MFDKIIIVRIINCYVYKSCFFFNALHACRRMKICESLIKKKHMRRYEQLLFSAEFFLYKNVHTRKKKTILANRPSHHRSRGARRERVSTAERRYVVIVEDGVWATYNLKKKKIIFFHIDSRYVTRFRHKMFRYDIFTLVYFSLENFRTYARLNAFIQYIYIILIFVRVYVYSQ